MASKSKTAWVIDVGQYGLRAIKLEAAGDKLQVSDFEVSALRPWTDDYSDILGPFLSKMKKRGG